MSHNFFLDTENKSVHTVHMNIGGQEITGEKIKVIQQIIEDKPEISRTALSRKICEKLNFRSLNGKLQEVSCRVALLKLKQRGMIKLPEVKGFPGKKVPDNAAYDEKWLPQEICCSLSDIQPIELIRIDSADSEYSRIWNEMMSWYHYLGAGPLCGAQIRYLFKSSSHGWVGGLSFSAAAWRLNARDQWIGWSEETRLNNLAKVIANSRFLILPQVRVSHLASHVLSLGIGEVGRDWLERYGYEPALVETFVERERFHGTCYKAANWIHIGTTRGRGRQDRENRVTLPVKDIFVMPLDKKNFRQILNFTEKKIEDNAKAGRSEGRDWAEEEFGEAALGDQRLEKRLLTIARDFYAFPQSNIPQACRSRAKAKAAYRFFEHSDTEMEKILQPHYESTQQRIAKEAVILVVQDTTTLNYNTHKAAKGLGPIGSQKEGAIGLVVHDTMAFNTEGTPMGLLDIQCWARDRESFGKKKDSRQLPIEKKESYKWLKSFEKLRGVQKGCPQTLLVNVCDREADIYEFFQKALEDAQSPKVLIRAEHDRLVAEGEGRLWERVKGKPASGIQVIWIPRRGDRPAREARLEVRFCSVTIQPPKGKVRLKTLSIWAVLAEEIEAQEGIEPLSWMLLTSIEVSSFEQAVEKLEWYTRRWGIELYHRTLKSGCKIEQRQFGSAESIEACLAVDMVIAWRIFYLTKLGRETPDVPCSVFFEEAEWKALTAYVTQKPVPPDKPPTLREAVRMVAGLGGFLGRKGDGEPGTKTLWLGLQRLDDITSTWKFMVINYVPHLLSPPCPDHPFMGKG